MGQKGERVWRERGKGFKHKRKGRKMRCWGTKGKEAEEIGDKRERPYREVTQKERRAGTLPY